MRTSKQFVAVDPDVARAWTLPSHLYTELETFEAEKERLFASGFTELLPRTLQREAGEGSARVSSDVCRVDERRLQTRARRLDAFSFDEQAGHVIVLRGIAHK